MTFAELKAEFAERGFAYMADDRQGRYINQARARLDGSDLWPYRESSVTGSPPMSVPDLGTIEMVMDLVTLSPVLPSSWQELVESYGDLSATGRPVYYYVAQPGGGDLEVATYPVGDIGVQYWRITPDLSGSSDEPLAPGAFHGLIVDMAVQKGYRDADLHAAAEALEVDIQRQLGEMRRTVLTQQAQGPVMFIAPVGTDC